MQTSDERFRAMSALIIGAASSEKNGWKYQAKSDIGDHEYYQQRSHLVIAKKRETHYQIGNKKMDLKIQFSTKASVETKLKMELVKFKVTVKTVTGQ